MSIRSLALTTVVVLFGAVPAFGGTVNFSFGFGGPDTALGTSQTFMSNGATITAYGYECSATSPSSTSMLSSCGASALFAKSDGPDETGLGLAGENDHEIGWDGPTADFVIGLDVSSLFKLGATSMTLNFGSVQAGEAFAILGYGSNPFLGGSVTLTNTKDLNGNSGSGPQVMSSTFNLNTNDEFLVIISPCAFSGSSALPCGSNVLLGSLDSSAPTPEPGTLALFATGLLALGFAMRRRFAFQR